MLAWAPLQSMELTPERLSEILPVIVTLDELKVAPFAGEVTVRAGGVLSM